jgi:serine/threonine protein kinase
MPKEVIVDGVYRVGRKLGKGGVATVFLAQVDLERFDYTTLYAYTQVQGATHTERRKNAEEFAGKLQGRDLDLATIRAILEESDIPLPAEQVALKVASSNDVDRQRFEGEWKNLLCLSHPNVVEVYGGGVYKKRPYYSMEYLEGLVRPHTIRDEFPIGHKIQVVLQGARGLQYLHGNGLVHRDVKPDNLVTCQSSDGNIVTKVTDLGIAKNLEEDLGLTLTRSVLGTPHYMAPEQVKSTRDVDHRADIYSLGATLYAFLTGHKPFDEKTTVYEIIMAVGKGESPTPPQEHVRDLPEPICSIIETAMARDPECRYQDMGQLVADLETYLETECKEVLNATHYSPDNPPCIETASGDGKYAFEETTQQTGSTVEKDSPPPVPPPAAAPKKTSAKWQKALPLLITGGILLAIAGVVAGLALLGGGDGETRRRTAGRQAAEPQTKEGEEAYADVLMAAMEAEQEGNWDKALELYRTAREKTDDLDRIDTAIERVQHSRGQDELNRRYQRAREEAQKLLDEERLETARTKLQEAANLAEQLDVVPPSFREVQARLAALRAARKGKSARLRALRDYRRAIAEATDLSRQRKWTEAKAAYQEALQAAAELDRKPPGYAYIQKQIAECNQHLSNAPAPVEEGTKTTEERKHPTVEPVFDRLVQASRAQRHPEGLAFSADGPVMALAVNQKIALWNFRSGRLEQMLTGSPPQCRPAVSPDGRRVAAASIHGGYGAPKLWYVGSRRVRTLTDMSGEFAFGPRGKVLAIGQGKHFILFDGETGRRRGELPAPKGYWDRPHFTPDGRMLAAAKKGENHPLAIVWDLKTGRPIQRIDGATAIATFPKGHVFGCCRKGEIHLFDVERGEIALSVDPGFLPDEGTIQHIQFSSDGSLVLCRSLRPHHKARLISIPDGQQIRNWPKNTAPMQFTPDGRWLAEASNVLAMVKLHRPRSENPSVTFAFLDGGKEHATWTEEGYYVATPAAEKLIQARVDGQVGPIGQYAENFHRPDIVAKKLAGEKVPLPHELATTEGLRVAADGQLVAGQTETGVDPGSDNRQTKTEDKRTGEIETKRSARLRRGMTPEQAIKLLGKPNQRGGAGTTEIWRYKDGTRLRFDAGALDEWELPEDVPHRQQTGPKSHDKQKNTGSAGEAETLYRRMALLFKNGNLHEARSTLEMLRDRHPDSEILTDGERDPKVNEIEDATRGLGSLLIVRQDGRGDHRSIQDAIEAAGPKSLIEVRDSGIYREQISIGKGQSGLIIRGADGCWPIVTSQGTGGQVVPYLVAIGASGTVLERLVILHLRGQLRDGGEPPKAIAPKDGITVRRLIVYCGGEEMKHPRPQALSGAGDISVEQSVLLGRVSPAGRVSISDSICKNLYVRGSQCRLTNVLLAGKKEAIACLHDRVNFEANDSTIISSWKVVPGMTFRDCIVPHMDPVEGGNGFSNCCVIRHGPPRPLPRLGRGCFRADPMFRAPAHLDYRLHPKSPCRGRASDGGDLGFSYTPAILELLQVVQKLKNQGSMADGT